MLSFDQLAQYRGLVSMVDGSFDCLHPGHLAYFRAARSLGYPLLCNICPDSETLKKHPLLLPARDRAEILQSLDILTYVHVSERPTVEILKQLRPAYYIKGTDWLDRLPQDIGQVCDELQIPIRYTATKTGSSSALLAKFQPDVDAFEALVQGQKAAEKPWEPVTDFSFDARKKVEGDHPWLIKEVLQPRKLLDVGCGPRGHLVAMLREIGVNAYGCDVQQCGSWAVTPEPIFKYLDITADDLPYERFDTVVCRELLEHLTIPQIRRAVTNLCRLGPRVYCTTRFNQNAQHFLDFATSDGLDPTHISIMPQAWLRHLFVLEGFKRREDLEDRMDHRQLGRVLVYERG